MEITWFGGTCLRIQSGQVTILTDPFDLSPDLDLPAAEIVTLSRRDARDRLQAKPPYRLVDGPGEYEIKGATFTGIATVSKDGPAPEGGPNTRNRVYSINLDGIVVCHLGRLRRAPSTQELQQLGTPDVLLLALGDPTGLPVQQAVALVSQLEAKILIPLTLGGTHDRAVLERFCKELGADPSNTEPRLSVTSSGLPAQARVVVLSTHGESTHGESTHGEAQS